MKMTKLMSTVAAIALMSSSAVAVSPNHMGQDTDSTWHGVETIPTHALNKYVSYFGAYAGNGATGGRTTFIGYEAGKDCLSSASTYIGYQAGKGHIGGDNIFIGVETGKGLTGTNNIILGNHGAKDQDLSDTLQIGSSVSNSTLIYGEFDNKLLRVNGVLDVNASSTGPDGGWKRYHALTLYADDIDPKKMAWGFWLDADETGEHGGLAITNAATGKNPLVISNDANNSLLALSKNSVAVNFDGFEIAEDAPSLIVGGDILATWSGENAAGDGATQLLTLDANNTLADKTSDVGFAIENIVDDFKWTFRTYSPSEGFAASKLGTGGPEFEVGNTGTDLSTTEVKMGGVVVFKDGSLVDGTGAPLALTVQKQSILLAEMEADAKAKDAELIAMKADAKAKGQKIAMMEVEISDLKTMQQKVAMMESILTNLALNTSDTDKTKVSVNLK